jgi:hypothetical protein
MLQAANMAAARYTMALPLLLLNESVASLHIFLDKRILNLGDSLLEFPF